MEQGEKCLESFIEGATPFCGESVPCKADFVEGGWIGEEVLEGRNDLFCCNLQPCLIGEGKVDEIGLSVHIGAKKDRLSIEARL